MYCIIKCSGLYEISVNNIIYCTNADDNENIKPDEHEQ